MKHFCFFPFHMNALYCNALPLFGYFITSKLTKLVNVIDIKLKSELSYGLFRVSLHIQTCTTKKYGKNTCDFNNAIQICISRKWLPLNALAILQWDWKRQKINNNKKKAEKEISVGALCISFFSSISCYVRVGYSKWYSSMIRFYFTSLNSYRLLKQQKKTLFIHA